ncbi:protein SAR DEFICIENT 1-like isoform X2 [Nymphaea colorata]|uniref:protein SAR DEFICIENT 1-like isoform X2 n=1 Tax=Nymphaea colorata TaxID=210225 RepID=UPI00214E0060|nr:protein SAR DEFICIENT 1-like isoform X2 [Nymphaea colorata]
MAAKRLLENGETPEEKRPRESSSLANAIREAVTNMPVENFRRALEPLFRRVVQEELGRSIQQFERVNNRRNGRLQLQECIEAPKLSLKFKEKLALPIFTSTNIEAQSNNPLELVIIDNQTGNRAQLQGLPPSLKVEILVVDGDFPPGDRESWTAEEFNSNVVRRREGKRPLLAGDVSITLKDGVGLIKLLSLTDNSSWTRSRKFRLGARVVKDKNGGIRIGEALSEAFIVKDHRGESYKKHHPPSLNDEVWRLEKIGKDGAFHQRLAAENINNVQDFLKLSVMDQPRLRMILGGMSDKMWEVTLAHAKECNLGQKMYVHHDISQSVIVGLNSICEPLTVLFGGLRFPIDGLNEFEKAQVQEVVKDAHQNWHKVKEMDMWPNTNLLPSTSDFNKESAGDSLIPTTSSLQQGTILLEAPDADVGPSFRSNSRIEFQLQDSGNYFPIYNHRVQTPGSTYPSRNLEDQDQLPNFYGHLP